MKRVSRLWPLVLAGSFATLGSFANLPSAEACGCFVPPDPSVPVVQAGENIIFEIDNGRIHSHIQIQYAGPASEFGWLLPLPTLPELSLGTDELFAQLINATQPKYRMDREYNGSCPFDPSRGFGNQDANTAPGEGDEDSPLVLQDSVGPYDYAVLLADDKQPMLDWLAANRFYVPAGTDHAVNAYIRPGAYFLALKLRKGNEVGDIQPVVVSYDSALPMIPIVLTSVAADPDMGIAAWVLGDARAIPRNYYHTVLNDAAIDWVNAGSNYFEVLTRAVDESPGHHSFVTEYAGTTNVMLDVLDYSGRFGDTNYLATLTDAVEFINYLNYNGYAVFDRTGISAPQYTSQVLAILEAELPAPAALLAAEEITANDYYRGIDYYLGWYRSMYPELFVDLDLTFDSDAMATQLQERVVAPTLAAGQLFRRNPKMTRLFTTMSANEMTRDPVFSFNPDLPDVSNTHTARLIYNCGLLSDTLDISDVPAQLVTEQGWTLSMPLGTARNSWTAVGMPASLRTEILREEGPPEIVFNNVEDIGRSVNNGRSGGCSVAAGSQSRSLAGLGMLFGLFGLVGLVLWRKRTR